ncbi:MAG: Asp-tRNA(Asn)/Glu-tRNA(Gln) amidotransferase subunit GatC [Patescibacteria group bacterium]|nr:Asp-tRNA(Asn)/Glu-tRNA(Gln) amidotransferase subunit GatC [Patescibacteria group bacterium]
MISEDQIKHIAKLARIRLKKKDIKKFQKELSSVLDYVEKLKKVNVSGVEPHTHTVLVENVMRKDQIDVKTKAKSEELLGLAPRTKDNYLKTKQILQ